MVTTRAEDNAHLVHSRAHDRRGEPIMKSSAVLAYNIMKKEVDLSDELPSYYTILRKTMKEGWY